MRGATLQKQHGIGLNPFAHVPPHPPAVEELAAGGEMELTISHMGKGKGNEQTDFLHVTPPMLNLIFKLLQVAHLQFAEGLSVWETMQDQDSRQSQHRTVEHGINDPSANS